MGKDGHLTGRRIRAAIWRMRRSPRRYWRLWQYGWGLAGLCFTLLALGALLVTTPWGCTPKAEVEPTPTISRLLRVRLMAAQDAVVVSAAVVPRYRLGTDPTERLLNLPPNVAVPVTLTPQGWRCGNATLGTGDLVLIPASLGSLRLGEKSYRGQLRLMNVAGKIDVINDVELDDYLKSVVSRELYPNWHEETYKAQAIIARTYALYERHSRETNRHFDLHADTRSQVYGGLMGETAKSRSAVESTAGVVVAYGPVGQERIFKAYFSSCCGGATVSSADAFREPYLPPLGEQSTGALCSAASKFTWGPVVVTKDELTRRLRLFGGSRNRPEKDMALIRGVEITARNRYKRPVRYTITDAQGQRYALTAEEFRWAVNTDAIEGQTLLSSFIDTVVNEPDRVRFIGGHGHGHGVGMCQWCSQARALAGMRHEDIVLAAYPGARLVRAY